MHDKYPDISEGLEHSYKDATNVHSSGVEQKYLRITGNMMINYTIQILPQ